MGNFQDRMSSLFLSTLFLLDKLPKYLSLYIKVVLNKQYFSSLSVFVLTFKLSGGIRHVMEDRTTGARVISVKSKNKLLFNNLLKQISIHMTRLQIAEKKINKSYVNQEIFSKKKI